MTESELLRPCLCNPIPEIADAARYLDAAVSADLAGHKELAEQLIRLADMPAIREWTESIWGPKSPYKKIRTGLNGPISMPMKQRHKARMPTPAEKRALLARDGYHCRFCGIPVVRGRIRQFLRQRYSNALPWGSTNPTQHAAFQAMWVQYDHILPHARGGDNSLENMVITCGPCNFGRSDYALEELGLIDPRTCDPVRSTWDGLERVRPLKKTAAPRSNKGTSTAAREMINRERFLSRTPPSTMHFFEAVISRSHEHGLEVVGTDAGLKVRTKRKPGFLFCYPPPMYNQGNSVMEVYLANLKDVPQADELRRRVAAVDHVVSAGAYSLRVFVTIGSLVSARQVLEIALDVMTRPAISA